MCSSDLEEGQGGEEECAVEEQYVFSVSCFLFSVLGFIPVSASLRHGRAEGKGRAEMK